jgi:hypothetical protein
MNELPFEEKFRVWWDSDNKIDEPWLIRDGHPLTRKLYESMYEWDRHKPYEICEDLEEEFQIFLDPDGYNSWVNEYPEYTISEEKRKILKQ